MKIILNLYLTLFVYSASFGQSTNNITGKWVDESDKLNVVIFKDDYFYDYYDNVLEDNGTFFLSDKCNVKRVVKKNAKQIFLNQISSDNSITCNEILSVNDKILTLMFPGNGNIAVFKKVKIKKLKTSNRL